MIDPIQDLRIYRQGDSSCRNSRISFNLADMAVSMAALRECTERWLA
jgi:hypothetical protein